MSDGLIRGAIARLVDAYAAGPLTPAQRAWAIDFGTDLALSRRGVTLGDAARAALRLAPSQRPSRATSSVEVRRPIPLPPAST